MSGRTVWLRDGDSPEALRAGLCEVLSGVPETAGLEVQEDAASRFLRRLGPLGFATGGRDEETRRMLDETAPQLERIGAGLAGSVASLKALLLSPFVGPEWREAAERRSALQFVCDLYAGRGVDAMLADVLEFEAVDDLLEQRAPAEGHVEDYQMPEGVPAEHWWWKPNDR